MSSESNALSPERRGWRRNQIHGLAVQNDIGSVDDLWFCLICQLTKSCYGKRTANRTEIYIVLNGGLDLTLHGGRR